MVQLFDGAAAAFAYLLLILLYFPCVAVLGAVHREAGLRWTAFMAVWSTGLGYGTAVLFYQLATIAAHPAQSLVWTALVLGFAALGLMLMKVYAGRTTALPKTAAERA